MKYDILSTYHMVGEYSVIPDISRNDVQMRITCSITSMVLATAHLGRRSKHVQIVKALQAWAKARR